MDRDDSDEKDSDDDREEDPRRKRRFCNERDDLPINDAAITKAEARLPSERKKLARSNRHTNSRHHNNKIEIVRNCIRKNFYHDKFKPIPALAAPNNNLITIRSSTANVHQSSNNHNNKFKLHHQRVPQTNQYNNTNVQHFNQNNSGFVAPPPGLYPESSQSSPAQIAIAPKIHVNPHFVKKFLRKSDNNLSFGNDDTDLSSAPPEAIHLAAAVVAANIVSANKLVSVTQSEQGCNSSNDDYVNNLNTQDKNKIFRPHNMGQIEPVQQRNINNNKTVSDLSGNGGQPIPVIGGSPNTVYNNNPSAIHFKRRQNACHQHSLFHSRFNQQYSDQQRFHLSKIPTSNINPLSDQHHASTSQGESSNWLAQTTLTHPQK